MDDVAKLKFEVAHVGINFAGTKEAAGQAEIFLRLFGIHPVEGQDSIYSGPLLELMKAPGRGTCGHIAIATDDIHAARVHLESLGHTFEQKSAKYDAAGRLIVLYLSEEFGGFAVHLLQKPEDQLCSK